MLGLSLAIAAAAPVASQPACAGYVRRDDLSSMRADARRVSVATRRATGAGAVDLVMADGRWRLVWATPAGSETGVFFFRRTAGGYRLADTWGGVALASERAATAAWAGKLGVPAGLARCFADRVVDGG